MKRIALQGIAGSFHEEAALKYFDQEIEVVECKSFTRVCELIDNDKVEYAVMAIENSIAGSLLKNYQLIRDYHLRIIGEIYLHIQMNLMAVEGVKMSDITDIYSHPIALQQCVEYLEKYFPDVQLHEELTPPEQPSSFQRLNSKMRQQSEICARLSCMGSMCWRPDLKPTKRITPVF